MSACLPCDLEDADDDPRVFRNDDFACEVADGYDVPGWFILRVRRHGEGWASLTPAEASGFGPVAQRLAVAMQQVTGASTVYFLSFGENYSHLHFLVIARPTDLPTEHRGAGILALRETNRDKAASLAVAADVRHAFVEAAVSAPSP